MGWPSYNLQCNALLMECGYSVVLVRAIAGYITVGRHVSLTKTAWSWVRRYSAGSVRANAG